MNREHTFWNRDRVHPSRFVWVAHVGPHTWTLTKITDRPDLAPGWYLAGRDTPRVWLGQRVGRAMGRGQRWIIHPHERESILREVRS